MKLNQIADKAGARKKRMRIGRGIGSGMGKTALMRAVAVWLAELGRELDFAEVTNCVEDALRKAFA